ncbi:glyoxalase/bleomycin resistance/dioxygenase family protein [Streptomyces sp. SID8379]|uniref:VOC family protein n=1 Tax=unclassified Streptomyces TaxID=2593676 RepID=UPI000377FCFE|nr:VOC family protein [Streptomyces sp. HmicA12]MYW67491.1 glyoxalase/bleomycin resistance/dioxygenase family protein [Streptomyces sp. SID8379]
MSATVTARWAHVGLNCRDQQATEEFYRRFFGFERARVVEADGARVVFLKSGPVYLELFPTLSEPAFPTAKDGPDHPGTARHLAFQVEDVDAFVAAADGELDVTLGPLAFDEFIPGWRTVWVSDPDGVVVEVSQGFTDQTPEELRAYE